jgi:hypothetical protein
MGILSLKKQSNPESGHSVAVRQHFGALALLEFKINLPISNDSITETSIIFYLFLSAAASGAVLGPARPPIRWVPCILSLVVKRPGREADHSPPSSAEVKE